MSDNYEPTVRVVRKQHYANRTWIEEDGFWPDSERALLARGVPMVGERVEAIVDCKQTAGVVEKHHLVLTVKWDDGSRTNLSNPKHFRPAIQNTEVGAVARALAKLCGDELNPGAYRDQARAAIGALDRARGRDE